MDIFQTKKWLVTNVLLRLNYMCSRWIPGYWVNHIKFNGEALLGNIRGIKAYNQKWRFEEIWGDQTVIGYVCRDPWYVCVCVPVPDRRYPIEPIGISRNMFGLLNEWGLHQLHVSEAAKLRVSKIHTLIESLSGRWSPRCYSDCVIFGLSEYLAVY